MSPQRAHSPSRFIAAALLTLCCIVTVRADFTNYQNTVLSQGPVGYWRLNDNTPVPDPNTLGFTATNRGSLGTAADGTYGGDLAGRAAVGAIAGNFGCHFDGSVEYVDVPYNAALNPAGDFTAECWFSPDGAGNTTCIMSSFDFDNGGSIRRGWIFYQGTQSQLQFRTYFGTSGNLTAITSIPMTVGTYYHAVLTRSNSVFRIYLNGSLAGSVTDASYLPATHSDYTIGIRSDGSFPWAGKIDEVAFYGSRLSDSTIAAHYSAATTNAAGYAAQIQLSSPVLYLRLDEAGFPETPNLGSLGSPANGKIIYPAVSQDPGPQSPGYSGLETTNVGVAFSGSSGSKLAGGYVRIPGLNLNTNTVTITTWVKPNGGQASLAGLIMQRVQTTSPNIGTTAGLVFDASPGLNLAYNWDGDGATYNVPTSRGLVDGQWNFVALIISPTSATLYIPNGTDPTPYVYQHNHGALKFEGTTALGTDITKNGFSGSIDEVAIFNRSLGLGEVYSEYTAATGTNPPVVFADPQSPAGTLYAGDSLKLTVDAGGTPANFTYQWRKNTTPINGANSSSYTINPLVAGGPDSYDCVITNNFGTATSGAAAVTVAAQAAPAITSDILATNRTLYAGGSIKLSIGASGGGLTYQWTKGGSPIGGATKSSLTIAGLVATNAGTYACTVSNATTSTATSKNAVIAIGAPAAGSYEALISADGPTSWWRMDDPTGSPTMLDAMGNNDGYYSNSVTLGTTSGALTNDANKAATFSVANACWGEVPALPPPAALGDFTYECWVRTSDLSTEQCPFSAFRDRYGFWFQIEAGGNTRLRDGYGDLDGNSSRQDLIGTTTSGQWTHLVAIYNSATVGQALGHKVYINGRWNNDGPFVDFCRDLNTPMRIGSLDPFNLDGLRKFFNGDIDEVAVYNKALTDSQILAHYLSAIYSTNGAPVFKQQPQNQSVFLGQTATFTSLTEGSPTVGQNWYKNGAAIPNATNLTFSVANAGYSDAIGVTYYCIATNFVGSTTSSVVTLTVLPQPAFVNLTNNLVLHLTFDGNYNDSSGHGHNASAVGSPTIVSGQVGSGALHYFTDTDAPNGHGGTVTTANYLTLGSFTNGSDLSFSNNISFSVCYWVKTISNGYGSGDLPFLCSANGSYQNKGITLAPTYSASTVGGWSWSLGDGSTFAGLYGPAGSINNGNWHHVLHAFSRTSGQGVTYLDGVQVNSTGFSILDNIDSGNSFSVGQDPTGAYNERGEYYLDDLCVWKNRVINSQEAYSAYYVGKTFGQSLDVVKPITITVTKVNGNYWLVWQTGTLQQADNVGGPYTPVGGAASPYYQLPLTGAKKFYRVQ
jgi:hypothetical protein